MKAIDHLLSSHAVMNTLSTTNKLSTPNRKQRNNLLSKFLKDKVLE